jgi:nitrogen fixation/metabolism regulation signal transduction histidine kinase
VADCTDDEIGHLGRSFNAMADEIERARDSELSAERDAAWREMARQVAHEIKNPLTPMALSVHMIRKARRDGSVRLDEVLDQSIAALGSQIEALKAIADDFSAVAGSSRSTMEEVDLAALCADLQGLYAGLALERGAEITWECSPEVVKARSLDMRRLLINLLDNACAAVGPEGRIEVRITGSGDEVVIEVADNGTGLAAEDGERLFDPAFSTKTGGAGLGLMICRRIVEDLGGTIRLANRPDGGAVAAVRIPVL